jgi:hypothetical protein
LAKRELNEQQRESNLRAEPPHFKGQPRRRVVARPPPQREIRLNQPVDVAVQQPRRRFGYTPATNSTPIFTSNQQQTKLSALFVFAPLPARNAGRLHVSMIAGGAEIAINANLEGNANFPRQHQFKRRPGKEEQFSLKSVQTKH